MVQERQEPWRISDMDEIRLRTAKVRLARLMKQAGVDLRHVPWQEVGLDEVNQALGRVQGSGDRFVGPDIQATHDSLGRRELDFVLEPPSDWES